MTSKNDEKVFVDTKEFESGMRTLLEVLKGQGKMQIADLMDRWLFNVPYHFEIQTIDSIPRRTTDYGRKKSFLTQDEVDEAESLLHWVLSSHNQEFSLVVHTQNCLELLQEQKTRAVERANNVAPTVAKKRKVVG